MTVLTTNERAFIEKMKENEELARHGFSLLLKRPDRLRFFQPLRDAGLFAAEQNPAPQPAPEQGYVRIPYWSALDYLVAVAKHAGSTNDLSLANQVMDIIRAVALWRDAQGQPRHNYHTAQRFTEILGHVPTAAVTVTDLHFLSTWLSDRFERMLVASAVNDIVLPHLLNSTNPEDWDKAVIVLQHVTAITWVDEPGTQRKMATTVVDDFWLQRTVQSHVQTLAAKCPWPTIQVLEQRIREVYATDLHEQHSDIYRAAIEDSDQNHSFRRAENLTVEAIRDALLTWAANEPTDARKYVENLLSDRQEILRRLAIYVMNQHWTTMGSLYLALVQRQPFSIGHLHELYTLLSDRFAEFNPVQQDATIQALRQIPEPGHVEKPDIVLKHLQQRWLTAMKGKGSWAVDEWIATLDADPTVGPAPSHPDYTSYMTFRTGPGASPYTVEELAAFATAHVLAERINTLEETEVWGGPTLGGLTGALQDAARKNPLAFLRSLSDLLDARPPLQQAIIRGLQQAWEAKQEGAPCNWVEGWRHLITFFEQIIARPIPREDPEHKHEWLLASIADCLRAGTQNDEHAYDPSLMVRAQAIIDALLNILPGETMLSKDPMFAAINTPKGRAIEALFSHVLRGCRVADKEAGKHSITWLAIQSVFDRELDACRNGNLEFSTLCGAYLAQLDYLNPEWTAEHVAEIFPPEFPANETCAVAGLAYAAFTESVYKHLLVSGVLDRALRYQFKGRDTRGNLMQRIAAAYVWKLESLDSPRFAALFATEETKELEQVVWFFSTLRRQPITDEQCKRILAFWERCGTWVRSKPALRGSLLSALSTLATYIDTIDQRSRNLLLQVAPFVGIGHNAYEFVSELLRLADREPDVITEVVDAMIRAHLPEYDYQDALRDLLRSLAAKGKKNEVLRILDQLSTLPGMHDLFNELTRPPANPEQRLDS